MIEASPIRAALAAGLCAALAVTAARAAEPPAAVRAAAAAADEPGRHALVVGIERFDDPAFPDLAWAEEDAEAFAEVLRERGFDSVALVTTDGDATRAALQGRVDGFLRGLGPDDTAVLYVSSHGVVDHVEGRPRRYLVTRDAVEADPYVSFEEGNGGWHRVMLADDVLHPSCDLQVGGEGQPVGDEG